MAQGRDGWAFGSLHHTSDLLEQLVGTLRVDIALETLLDALPGAIVVVDDGGRIAFADSAVHELSGHAPEDLVGHPVEALVPPAKRHHHEQARRLAEIEAAFDPLPIDAPVARAYGMLAHAVVEAGRKPRRRAMDLLIAATAHALGVPLYTRDPADFAGLEGHVDLRVV